MGKSFMWLSLLIGLAALAGSTLFVRSTKSGEADPVAWITQYEHDAVAADLAGDVSFYEKKLADDWSDGRSDGQFQNKKELISDLADKAHNATLHETLAKIKVRVYGDTAVATYTETYDAMVNGSRVAKTIITTDTFARLEGQWKLVAAHSSAVPAEAHAQIIGAWNTKAVHRCRAARQGIPDVYARMIIGHC